MSESLPKRMFTRLRSKQTPRTIGIIYVYETLIGWFRKPEFWKAFADFVEWFKEWVVQV